MFYLFFHWQIYFKKKKTGGISFNSTLPLTHVDEKLCYQILHEYKIHNAEVPALFLNELGYIPVDGFLQNLGVVTSTCCTFRFATASDKKRETGLIMA